MCDLAGLMRGLLTNCRVVDLSEHVRPGVLKVDGRYEWGDQTRRAELRQFIAPDGYLMHWADLETHVGTHVEVPAHWRDGAKSCADMPVERFFGEAIAIDFSSLTSPDGRQRPQISPEHLRQVRPGDIVLAFSQSGNADAPAISPEAARHLAALPIKMLGEQDVGVGEAAHEELLARDIPIIERLAHCQLLRTRRVLFFGLPLRMQHLDSSWIRAIAFEPME